MALLHKSRGKISPLHMTWNHSCWKKMEKKYWHMTILTYWHITWKYSWEKMAKEGVCSPKSMHFSPLESQIPVSIPLHVELPFWTSHWHRHTQGLMTLTDWDFQNHLGDPILQPGVIPKSASSHELATWSPWHALQSTSATSAALQEGTHSLTRSIAGFLLPCLISSLTRRLMRPYVILWVCRRRKRQFKKWWSPVAVTVNHGFINTWERCYRDITQSRVLCQDNSSIVLWFWRSRALSVLPQHFLNPCRFKNNISLNIKPKGYFSSPAVLCISAASHHTWMVSVLVHSCSRSGLFTRHSTGTVAPG